MNSVNTIHILPKIVTPTQAKTTVFNDFINKESSHSDIKPAQNTPSMQDEIDNAKQTFSPEIALAGIVGGKGAVIRALVGTAMAGAAKLLAKLGAKATTTEAKVAEQATKEATTGSLAKLHPDYGKPASGKGVDNFKHLFNKDAAQATTTPPASTSGNKITGYEHIFEQRAATSAAKAQRSADPVAPAKSQVSADPALERAWQDHH